MSTALACLSAWVIVVVALEVLNAMRHRVTPWHLRAVWIAVAGTAFVNGIRPPDLPLPAALLLAMMAVLAWRFRGRLVWEAAPTRNGDTQQMEDAS